MSVSKLGVVFACACVCLVHAAEKSKLLTPGTEAPPYSLPALDGGREALRVWCGDTLLKPYANSVKHTVILNFWATYCKPCQKEIPQIASFLKKHEGEPIKAFFISIDKEGVDKVRPFVKEKGYQVEVLLDMYARTAERYGVKSVPALFVLAPNGTIYYAASGFDEKVDLSAKLESIYAEMKAGKAPARREVEVAGEQVRMQQEPRAAAVDAGQVPAKERWRAVVRVECGEDASEVAQELGISVDELKAWAREIKRAAAELWPD
jgi:thiol-disulfide isomerase/thioredoxin